jgi:hypothetical protein
MRSLQKSVVAVLALAVMVGCDRDFAFEPPPYQVEPPPPPPEYQIAHTFTYVPHEDGPDIESIVVRGEFEDFWSGNRLRMTLYEGVWSVTVPLEGGESYQYKYVFNGENWAGNMCAEGTWGNPPGGPVDPNIQECDGENGVLVVDPEGLPAHTFEYIPHEDTPEIESIVVRGEFQDFWSGNRLRMTLWEDTWSVTVGLEPGRYQYKYVFNGENWAGNMCAEGTWGNPPGGPVDPNIQECDGENGVLEIQ